jgi:hypothetical protein
VDTGFADFDNFGGKNIWNCGGIFLMELSAGI